MDVKISSRLPQGNTANGLGVIHEQLCDRPGETHLVIATVYCSRTTVDHDTGEVTPTAKILHIEPIVADGDRDRAHRLMERAHERRIGASVLPIGLEDDLRAIDPATGELP